MAKEPETRKTLVLPDTLWAEISDYRFSARIVTEMEAVRRLLRKGLAATQETAAPVSGAAAGKKRGNAT